MGMKSSVAVQSGRLNFVQFLILRLLERNALQRQLGHSRFDLANHDLASRGSDFAPNVSQRQRSFGSSTAENRYAGDLAHFLVAGTDLVARRDRRRAFYAETSELPMHIAPRSNTLHNFLAHITALVKVERAHLFGFLRQVTLPNIGPVERDARNNTLHLQRFAPHRCRTRGNQSLPRGVNIVWREPDVIRFLRRGLTAHHRAIQASAIAAAARRMRLERLQFGNFNARPIQDGPRPGSGQPQSSPAFADVLHLHVVHDDEVVEGRDDLLELATIRLDREHLALVVTSISPRIRPCGFSRKAYPPRPEARSR